MKENMKNKITTRTGTEEKLEMQGKTVKSTRGRSARNQLPEDWEKVQISSSVIILRMPFLLLASAGAQHHRLEQELLEETVDGTALTGPGWRMNVYLVAGADITAHGITDDILRELNAGRRPRVKALSLQDILQGLMPPDKKRGHAVDDSMSALHRHAVRYKMHPVVNCLSEKGEISAEILAMLIKHRLLALKEESIFIRDTELSKSVQAGEEIAEAAASSVGTTDQDSRARDRSTSKSGAGMKGTSKTISDTRRMKDKRKMSDRLSKGADTGTVIVDWPRGGPQLYVILFGFYDSQLPLSMVTEGIPLMAILKISDAKQGTDELHAEHQTAKNAVKNAAPNKKEINRTTKKSKAKGTVDFLLEELPLPTSKIILGFWSDLVPMFEKDDASLLLKDVALSEFSVGDGCDVSLHEGEFDDFMKLIYDLEHFHQHHILYLSNMHVSHVVEVEHPANVQSMTIYNDDVSSIPEENVTIQFIVQCMLNQIEDANSVNESTKQSHNDDARENEIVDVTPIIISHGDSLKKWSVHLLPEKANDFYQNALNVLRNLPVLRLWDRYRALEDLEREKYDFHINRLHHFCGCEEITKRFLCHHLHNAVFGKLRGDVSKQKHLMTKPYRPRCLFRRRRFPNELECAKESTGELVQEEVISPKNDSFIDPNYRATKMENLRRMFECEEISSLLACLGESPSSIPSENSMENYKFLEKMDSNVMIQTVCKACESFCCMSHHYFKPTDVLLLHFFQGIATKSWRTKLTTPVGFRDFHNFVLKEEWDWLQEEMRRYWKNSFVDKSTWKNATSLDCLQLHDEWEMLCEERGLKKYDEKPVSKLVSVSEEKPVSRLLPKILGYDVIQLRIQVGGNKTEFASPDGTKVTAEVCSWIRGSVSLGTNILMSGHMLRFSTLPSVGGFQEQLLFHLTSSTGVVVAFCMDISTETNQQTGVILRRDSVDQMEKSSALSVNNKRMTSKRMSLKGNTKPLNNSRNNKNSLNGLLEEDFSPTKNNNVQRKFKSDVSISCPSGLCVKTASCGDSNVVHYIKQYYLQEHNKEKHRCILRDGRVLRFLLDDSIEILCPDGTICLCERFCRLQEQQKGQVDSMIRKQGNANIRNALENLGKKRNSVTKEETVVLHSNEFELWRVSDAHTTSIWGKRDQIQDGVVKGRCYIPVKIATDHHLGEIFIRRRDGTNYFLKSDGELIVSFPDGTRITSSWLTEKDAVFCEWSCEDVSRYHIALDLESCTDTNMQPASSDMPEIVNGGGRHQLHPNEGFVSVIMKTTVEHPNFATVSFSGENGECALRLPQNVQVILHTDGNMSVNLSDSTKLATSGNSLTFSSQPCHTCRAACQSVVTPSSAASVGEERVSDLCTTRDILGNCFTVRNNGTCLFQGADFGANDEAGAALKNRQACPHRMLPQNRRCFVLRRDFSGEEILHEQDVENHLNKVRKTEDGLVHRYEVPGRPQVVVLNTFVPRGGTEWSVPYTVAKPLPQCISWLDLQLLPLGLQPGWLHGKHCAPAEHRPTHVLSEDNSWHRSSEKVELSPTVSASNSELNQNKGNNRWLGWQPSLEQKPSGRVNSFQTSTTALMELRRSSDHSKNDSCWLEQQASQELRSFRMMSGGLSNDASFKALHPPPVQPRDARHWLGCQHSPETSSERLEGEPTNSALSSELLTSSDQLKDGSYFPEHQTLSEQSLPKEIESVSTSCSPPMQPYHMPTVPSSYKRQQLVTSSVVNMEPKGTMMFDMLRSALVKYKSAAEAIVEQYSSHPHVRLPADEEQLQAYLMKMAVAHLKIAQDQTITE